MILRQHCTKTSLPFVISVKGGFHLKNTIVDEKDRSAIIEAVIREYADMIYRIAYQHMGNHHDAEDILQEVSIALVTKDAPLQDREYLKRWLIRVTINKCHDLYRQKRARETEDLDDYINTPSEQQDAVMEEILQLPEKYKTVIYLYYYESFTLKEIADTLKKSINTVSSELQRARKKLKKILTEEELPYEEK